MNYKVISLISALLFCIMGGLYIISHWDIIKYHYMVSKVIQNPNEEFSLEIDTYNYWISNPGLIDTYKSIYTSNSTLITQPIQGLKDQYDFYSIAYIMNSGNKTIYHVMYDGKFRYGLYLLDSLNYETIAIEKTFTDLNAALDWLSEQR